MNPITCFYRYTDKEGVQRLSPEHCMLGRLIAQAAATQEISGSLGANLKIAHCCYWRAAQQHVSTGHHQS